MNGLVERGAAMLDEISPQWYEHINLMELSLRSNRRCVLGQLARKDPVIIAKIKHAKLLYAQRYYGYFRCETGSFDFVDLDAALAHGFIEGGPVRHAYSAQMYGFMSPASQNEKAWKEAIKERRKEAERRAKAAKALRVLEPDQERLEAILASYELVA